MTGLSRPFLCWRQTPGFALTAVLTLGIAIGANTTIFSLVAGIMFPAPEFADADRLVTFGETSDTQLCAGCGVGTSRPTLADWRAHLTAVGPIAAYTERRVVLSAPLVPREFPAAEVSPSLFRTLGVAPVVGRDFDEADARPGAPPVVLVGHALWRGEFAGDRAVVGQPLRVNGVPHTVIGVMPDGIGFPEFAELWTPLAEGPAAPGAPGATRDDRSIGAIARLAPGRTLTEARAELSALAATLASQYAEQREWSATVTSLADDRADETGAAFTTLLGAVGLVLAVACANLGALFLARASRQARELSIRTALGATRRRLMLDMLGESVQLAVAGGVVGLLLARAGIGIAMAQITTPIPYYVHVAIDWRVVVFCFGAALTAGILCGLAPAWAATRPDVMRTLKGGGHGSAGADRRQARLGRVLLVGELALVLVLLAGAALMGRTFLRFQAPPAYSLAGLTKASVPWHGARYETPDAMRAAGLALDAELARRGGWQGGLAHLEFLRGFGAEARSTRTERGEIPADRAASFGFAVTPGYLEALGLPMRDGRAFDRTDVETAEPVVIVNEAFAEAAWPGERAVGRRVLLPIATPTGPSATWRTVVGVLANSDPPRGASQRSGPFVYFPFAQLPGRPVELLVRTDATSVAVGDALQHMVSAIDPDQPVSDVRDALTDQRRQYWHIGFLSSFFAAFGGFALLLAVIGLYGVVSHSVEQRTREFGVRAALGAAPAQLARGVLARSAALAAVAGVAGLALTALLTRALGGMLYGTNPLDPLVLVGVSALLVATAVAASYVPARRAMRADPLVALRAE
jgi:predicted permease